MDTLLKYQELRNKTVPGVLFERAKNTPNNVAYRAKKLGIYKERTWSEFCRMVSKCALGFRRLGLKRGDRLALMGDPCEEYVICELAGQALGAVTYGIYPTSSGKELYYLMEDGGASIFVAENQEYVDKILPLYDKLNSLKHVIVIDTKGTFMYDHPSLIIYERLMEDGEKEFELKPESFEQMLQQVHPSDNSFIVYTSGTTGNPKGAVISHGKHLAAAYTLVDRFPILKEVPHRTVVYLPLCHVLGHVVAVTLPLFTNIVPHYGEDIEDLGLTIFETAPTVLFTVPRYLQKFASSILVGIENSSALKKLVYRTASKIGRRHLKNIWDGRKNHFLGTIYLIFYQIAFRPILNKIGFDKLCLTISGGASLPREVMALWQIYRINLTEMYGQTETGGAIISAQAPNFPKPGNVGISPSGWKVKLAENGEILVRGNDIFEFYFNNPKGTSEVIDNQGWLHTGDKGEWTPEGNLKIVDRVRDFMVTSGGKTISPTYIENALKSSPYISEAVVYAHNRKYISALIEIDFETLSNWARSNNISYTGFTNLTQQPDVIKFVASEIEKANRDIARVEQVKRFRIIPKELDPEEDGEPVTPTRKIKRELMYQKFRELVESMYGDKEEQLVASEVGDLLNK
jgi:long-chain acyl-CoA synthetase